MGKKLSLVVPVYFEEECISQFIKETVGVLGELNSIDSYEIVFVDDGSKDNTTSIIKQFAADNKRLKLIELSYNHGKQAAFTAGVTYADGDYFLYMDPDLQDPPEEIPRFLEEIEKGYDLVFGVRKEKQDSFLNRSFSAFFWFILDKLSGLELPRNLAVMRIFNKKFAEKFLLYNEQNRFIEGIFKHIGMKQGVLKIDQRERFAGESKFDFKKKVALAFDAILDYSELPLKLAVKLGGIISFIGLISLLTVLILKVTIVNFQAGWPSLFSILVIGFGIQVLFTGLASLYIGRIYKETKSRPLFSIESFTNHKR